MRYSNLELVKLYKRDVKNEKYLSELFKRYKNTFDIIYRNLMKHYGRVVFYEKDDFYGEIYLYFINALNKYSFKSSIPLDKFIYLRILWDVRTVYTGINGINKLTPKHLTIINYLRGELSDTAVIEFEKKYKITSDILRDKFCATYAPLLENVAYNNLNDTSSGLTIGDSEENSSFINYSCNLSFDGLSEDAKLMLDLSRSILTSEEYEVIVLVTKGYIVYEVAKQLKLSEPDVKKKIKIIRNKMSKYASQFGIIL